MATPAYLRIFSIVVLVATSIVPLYARAQATLTPDTVTIAKAQVSATLSHATSSIPGTSVNETTQNLTATILDGPDAGKSITFENDYTPLAVGDVFYLRHSTNALDGTDLYAISDIYRIPVLAALAGAFLILLFAFGGKQGIRGLLALIGSVILILYALVPGLLHGLQPAPTAIAVSSLIIILGSYITHGLNKTTHAAVLGMLATLVLTGALGYFAISLAHLTGYSNEETAYLNFNLHGTLDAVGLVYAGIMIGLLGVLYDIAIGQAVAIEELFAADVHPDRRNVYTRAIRIGREHIGALVNTLAIAYVGAALPLLLLVQSSTYGILYMINSELFATEIIRILIGSIGLILAVPITSLIATRLLAPRAQ